MNTKEKKFTKEEAFELLSYDTIRENIYHLLNAVGAKYEPDVSASVYTSDEHELSSKDYWSPVVDNILEWINGYKALNKTDRLFISDLVLPSATSHLHGTMLLVNGQNGMTQVSRQSLKHVMDIICHLEDYYGARAWISYVGMHSDVYYYGISFAIWKEHIEDAKSKHKFGNLKPLYYDKQRYEK